MAFNDTKGLRLTKENDLIIQSKHQANGAIIGMMLGDSSMYKYLVTSKMFDGLSERRRSRIQMSTSHCEKQLNYLLWKESIINSYVKFGKLITDNSKIDKGFIYYKKTSLVESSKLLVYLYENFYAHRVKRVTSKILNRLTDSFISHID
jgi:stress-induced morphogen